MFRSQSLKYIVCFTYTFRNSFINTLKLLPPFAIYIYISVICFTSKELPRKHPCLVQMMVCLFGQSFFCPVSNKIFFYARENFFFEALVALIFVMSRCAWKSSNKIWIKSSWFANKIISLGPRVHCTFCWLHSNALKPFSNLSKAYFVINIIQLYKWQHHPIYCYFHLIYIVIY